MYRSNYCHPSSGCTPPRVFPQGSPLSRVFPRVLPSLRPVSGSSLPGTAGPRVAATHWTYLRKCPAEAGPLGQHASLSPSFAKSLPLRPLPSPGSGQAFRDLPCPMRTPDPDRFRGSGAQDPATLTRHFAECLPHARSRPASRPHPVSAPFFLRHPASASASPPPALLLPGPPRLFPGPQPAPRLRLLPRDQIGRAHV